jgi:hypothetical protein
MMMRLLVLISVLCWPVSAFSQDDPAQNSVGANPCEPPFTHQSALRLPGKPERGQGEDVPCDPRRVAPPPMRDRELPAIPDRWRIVDSLPGYDYSLFNPYNRNVLKGDKPVYGDDWFFAFTGISDTVYEARRLPTPVGIQTTSDPDQIDVFGEGEQSTFNQNLLLEFAWIKGDTVFRPPDWEFRLIPVINYNRSEAEERRVLRIDPREGETRTDDHIGVQGAFVDYHIRNVSERYDFDSLRVGIQPFNADFRGFLFQDNQFGIRLFGTRRNNIFQYNLAWFRRLEKDTNSGLNDVGEELRKDDVFVANVYWQDMLRLGFFSQATILHNRNREDEFFYDNNGFVARPSSLGFEKPRHYDVTYLGLNGDGHFGRLNLTVSGYAALGDSSRGVFVDEETDIRAFFAAAEAGWDQDWIRYRGSLVLASGDPDPYDDVEEGFDAVFENPIIAGADTSFWIRQGVPFIGGGGVTLSTRNGVLPNLRPNKEHGQSNFTNPGLVLAGAGVDLDLTPTTRLSFNANHLSFADTATLEAARMQSDLDPDIGWDVSAALIWRPLAIQNIVFRLSGAALLPGDGYKQLYKDETGYSVLSNLILTY